MKREFIQQKIKILKRWALIFIILAVLGCANLSGSTANKGPQPVEGTTEEKKTTQTTKGDTKAKSKWDIILDQLGFWIRWIPTDIIIFP